MIQSQTIILRVYIKKIINLNKHTLLYIFDQNFTRLCVG